MASNLSSNAPIASSSHNTSVFSCSKPASSIRLPMVSRGGITSRGFSKNPIGVAKGSPLCFEPNLSGP